MTIPFLYSRNKLRAFEYRVNDEDSEVLGTAIILEVLISRHHVKARRQVRQFFFKTNSKRKERKISYERKER